MASRVSDNSDPRNQVGLQRQPQGFKSIFANVITVVVGEGDGKGTFLVHPDIISSHSSFFKAACSAQWAEGQVKRIELSQQSPADFELYLKWVYSSMNDIMVTLHDHWTASTKFLEQDFAHQRRIICICLVRMWMLADYLGDADCKDKVLHHLLYEDKGDRFPPIVDPDLSSMGYSGTTQDAKIRQWLVHHTIQHMSRQVFERHSDEFPQEMVTDMLKAFLERKDQVDRKAIPKVFEGFRYWE